jgi:hypothetical protein
MRDKDDTIGERSLERVYTPAETGGFEPPKGFDPFNTLAPCRFQPLTHVSISRRNM